MSDAVSIANPFRTWTDLARGLRERFVKELDAAEAHTPPSPHLSEFMGTLASLITHLERLDARLIGLERHDHPAFEAFLRALENS